MKRTITADVVVAHDKEIAHGYVTFDNGIITEIGEHAPVDAEKFAGTLTPGFVDIHCHGGGGFSLGKIEQVQGAADFHLAHGTTTLLASLVSLPVTYVVEFLQQARALVESGVIAGVHMEGPFLAVARCGAQNPAAIVDPTQEAIAAILKAGDGVLRLITMAPESEGAISAITALVERGITVAIGHSEATAAQGQAAFDAGARVITHFFNGMRPYDHADTSFGMAALDDARVSTELIADGVHVGIDKLEMMKQRKGKRFIAVTDAIVAAGMPDGEWDLGGLSVTTAENVARLTGTQTLAGSTLTMDRAYKLLRDKVDFTALDAAYATATEPARVLGINDVGAIEVGKRANFVVWNDCVSQVIRDGVNV